MITPEMEDFRARFNDPQWRAVAENICRRHRIPFSNLHRSPQGESVVFLVDDRFIIKIYIPYKTGMERERLALETARTSLKIPEIVAFGELENYKYLVTTQIHGDLMTREIWLKLAQREQIEILARLADGLKTLHRSDTSKIDFDWRAFVRRQAETCFERQQACGVNEKVLAAIPAYLEKNLPLLETDFREVFLHGDVHFGNGQYPQAVELYRAALNGSPSRRVGWSMSSSPIPASTSTSESPVSIRRQWQQNSAPGKPPEPLTSRPP